MMKTMDYKEKFKNIPIEQKRNDLIINPFLDSEKIKSASDEEIEQLYLAYFSALDQSMQDVMGESMFDDEE